MLVNVRDSETTIEEIANICADKYQCKKCSKSFDRAAVWKHHKQSFSSRYLENIYQCDLCENMYSNKKNVEKHLETHNTVKPFTCHFCRKKFPNQKKLKKHARKHAKELRNNIIKSYHWQTKSKTNTNTSFEECS